MSLDTTAIMNAVLSHAAASGYFDRVAGHEPKNAPGNGLSAAVWVDRIGPVPAGSGLAATSALVVLNVVTRGTWDLPVSAGVSLAVGAVFVVIGLATKLWAARTLGSNAYYWHNFFDPEGAVGPVSSGPYRFISSPMYTVGYLPTYGLALLFRSFPGLIAAVFSQAAILTFNFLVEKPHFQRLHRSS